MGFLGDLVGAIGQGLGAAGKWGEDEIQNIFGGGQPPKPSAPPTPQQAQTIGQINQATGMNSGQPGPMPTLQAPQIQAIKIDPAPSVNSQNPQQQQPQGDDVAGMVQKAMQGANQVVSSVIPSLGMAEQMNKAIQDNADKIPVNHGADIANEAIDESVQNPILNAGAKFLASPLDIGQAILNTPHDVAKLDQVAGQTKSNPTPYAGDVANDAIQIASIIPAGKVADVALDSAPLAERAVEGALTGAKYGTGYGAAQGVASTMQQPGSTPVDYLKNAATGAVESGLFGAAAGGITPAGVDAFKAVRDDLRNPNGIAGNEIGAIGKDVRGEDQPGEPPQGPGIKATPEEVKQFEQSLNAPKPDMSQVGEALGRTRAQIKQLEDQQLQARIANEQSGFPDAGTPHDEPLADLRAQERDMRRQYAQLKSQNGGTPEPPAPKEPKPEDVEKYSKLFNVSKDEARGDIMKAEAGEARQLAGNDQSLGASIDKNGLSTGEEVAGATGDATGRALSKNEIGENRLAPNPIELPKAQEGDPAQGILNRQAVRDKIARAAQPAVDAANALSAHDHALLDDLRTQSAESLAKKAENPQAFMDAANKAKYFNDLTYALGAGQGQMMRYLDRYGAAELYDRSDPETAAILDEYAKAAQTREKAGYTQERTIPSYAEGERLGLKRLNENFAQDLIFDAQRRSNHISELALKNGLEQAYPGQVAFGEIPRGYTALRIAGGTKISMPTEIADQLNKRAPASEPNTGVKAFDKLTKNYDVLNREMKYYGLGGGTFHAEATATSVAGQQLLDSIRHPSTIPGKLVDNLRVIGSTVSNKLHDASMKAWESNGDAHTDGFSTLDRAKLSGVTMTPEEIKADIGTKIDWEKVKGMGFIKAVHDMVFARQIPEAKLMIFEQQTHGLDLNNPEDMAKMRQVAHAVNNLGGINRAIEGLTPEAAQKLGRWVLATDYTEGRVNRVVDALSKPPGTPQGDIAREMLVGKAIVTALPGMIAAAASGTLKTPEDWAKEFVKQLLQPQIVTPIKDSKGRSKIAHMPGTEVSDLAGIFTPMFDGTTDANGNPDPLAGIKHFGTARLAKAPSTIWSILVNKNYYGNDVIARNDDNSINLLKTAGNVLTNATPIPIAQGIKVAQGQEGVPEAVLNTLGNRVSLNPNDPQVRATNAHYTEQQQLENLFKEGKWSQINPALQDVSPQEAQRVFADQYGPSHTAAQKDALGNTVPHDWNALSNEEKAVYYLQNDQNSGKQELSPTFFIDQKLAQQDPSRPHSALFDLQGDGVDPNHPDQPMPKAQIALNYMNDGDPSEKAVMLERNPWLADFEKASIAEAQNYKQNMTTWMQNQGWTQPAIDQYWQQHPSATPPIQYPPIDAPLQQKLDMLNNMDDPAARTAFIKGNPDLGVAFQEIAQYTNQMRDARGQLMLKGAPQPTPQVQALLDQMSQGTDKASKVANAKLIQGNPALQDYLADVAIHGLTDEAAKARFQGEDLSQKALKDIYSVGHYDTVKNADGTYSQIAGTTAGGTPLASTGQVFTPGQAGSGPKAAQNGGLANASDNTGIKLAKAKGGSTHPHIRIKRLHSAYIKSAPHAGASATGHVKVFYPGTGGGGKKSNAPDVAIKQGGIKLKKLET